MSASVVARVDICSSYEEPLDALDGAVVARETQSVVMLVLRVYVRSCAEQVADGLVAVQDAAVHQRRRCVVERSGIGIRTLLQQLSHDLGKAMLIIQTTADADFIVFDHCSA